MTDQGERKALADIRDYGLHVINVLEGDSDQEPPFSYSIGVGKALGYSDFVMIGLRNEIAHRAINTCFETVKEHGPFEVGQSVSDLLEGFDCRIGSVDREWANKHLGWARWFYVERDFSFQQIIFPSTSGVWPWEPEADDWFRQRQPILGRLS